MADPGPLLRLKSRAEFSSGASGENSVSKIIFVMMEFGFFGGRRTEVLVDSQLGATLSA